jgi:hypothetical protein
MGLKRFRTGEGVWFLKGSAIFVGGKYEKIGK